MNSKALDLNHSINWLKAGKVLVHPTESIWGIGCDALNETAIDLIFKLKQRPLNKNLIVLVESYFSIRSFVILVTTETLLSDRQVNTTIPEFNFDLTLSELFFKSLGQV